MTAAGGRQSDPQPPTDSFTVDLRGRTALITGGTRGIGRALASGFARAGANVVVGARSGEACAQVAGELTGDGGSAIGIPVHLAEADSVEQFVSAAAERFEQIDFVINNAATGLAAPLGEFTTEAWEKSFAVNLRGPVFLIQHAMPYLERSSNASIVNVISPGAFGAAASWAMYAAGKAALLSFTRSMAAAYGPKRIRVNALCPGPINTEMFRSNPPALRDEIARSTCLGRVGEPEEMVGPVLFLCSSAATFVTGEVLFANGGNTG